MLFKNVMMRARFYMKISDIMTSNVITLSSDDTIGKAKHYV